jgi:hypothetical protein
VTVACAVSTITQNDRNGVVSGLAAFGFHADPADGRKGVENGLSDWHDGASKNGGAMLEGRDWHAAAGASAGAIEELQATAPICLPDSFLRLLCSVTAAKDHSR